MPRTARASRANYCYHVLNRGNGRAQVFHKPGDYEAFVALFERACERLPMRLLAYCLMLEASLHPRGRPRKAQKVECPECHEDKPNSFGGKRLTVLASRSL